MKQINMFITFLIACAIITHTVCASEVFVSNTDNLQMKLDNATAGDIIYVEGTHPAVDVKTQDIVIVSDNADVAGFMIWEPNVTIKGFRTEYISISDMMSECDIVNNIVEDSGISVNIGSGMNIIRNNTIFDCHKGIYIIEGYNNTVENNVIYNCSNGIAVVMSNSDTIKGNTIRDNEYGINLLSEDSNIFITDNNIINNSNGIRLGQFTSYNYIYNNYFYNVNNVVIEENDMGNTWNTTKTSGTNIIGSGCIQGNYWGREDGNGFSQITNDTNGDCIAELPYIIDENNIDYGVLTDRHSAVNNTTETIPEVIEDDSSSSGSSGGSSHSSGGSVGGSPEPAKNVASKSVVKTRITHADKNVVKFSSTNITGISFDITRSYGKQPVIVEELKNKSTLTTGRVPSNNIIEYFNIWISSNSMINKQNLKNATIEFKLPNSVSDNKTISVYRYDNDTWKSVTFGKMNSDKDYTYYKIKTEEYGQFAICANDVVTIKPASTNKIVNNTTSIINDTTTDSKKERIEFWKMVTKKIREWFSR